MADLCAAAGRARRSSHRRDARHELYLMCDDIQATVEALRDNGAEFTKEISDEGWGRVTALRLPGGSELALYEPRHPSPPVSAG